MKITKNLATADKIVRLTFAVVITTLFVFRIISGPLAGGLLVLSGIFVISVLVSWIPLAELYHRRNSNEQIH